MPNRGLPSAALHGLFFLATFIASCLSQSTAPTATSVPPASLSPLGGNGTSGPIALDTSKQSIAFLVWVLGSIAAFLLLVSGCYVTLMWQQKAFREYKATFEEQLKNVSRIRREVCEKAADYAMAKGQGGGGGGGDAAGGEEKAALEGGIAGPSGGSSANNSDVSSSDKDDHSSGGSDDSESSVDMAPAALRARILGQKYVALKLTKQKALKPLIANRDKASDLVKKQATVLVVTRPADSAEEDVRLAAMVDRLMREDREMGAVAPSLGSVAAAASPTALLSTSAVGVGAEVDSGALSTLNSARAGRILEANRAVRGNIDGLKSKTSLRHLECLM
jgi:hypothetical protein